MDGQDSSSITWSMVLLGVVYSVLSHVCNVRVLFQGSVGALIRGDIWWFAICGLLQDLLADSSRASQAG